MKKWKLGLALMAPRVHAETLYIGSGEGTAITATAAEINGLGESVVTVANKTGGTLSKGTLVYVSGYDTTLGEPSVTAADADTGGKVAELVLTADIANDASGAAATAATVTGIDTSGASAVGSLAYLSNTAGEFAWAAPTDADDVVQVVGVCITKNATTGSIEFFPGRRVITKVPTSGLADGAVTTAKIADDQVTAAKTDTATAGTVEASKIVVAGANKNVDTLAIADGGLKLGAGAGTAVTATAAELNLLDGAGTGGTVVASKAQIGDANQNIGVVKATGLHIGTSGSETEVTATAAELNLLDGITQGSIISGQGAGSAELDASGDGYILVGDGTDVASVAVSGDVTLANTGAVTIAAEAVEASMIKDDSLDGSHAAVYADSGLTPCLPVLYSVVVDGGAAADDDITIAEKVKVVDIWAVHTGGAGEASDTLTVKNATNAISDAMAWTGGDKVIVRAGELDDAYTTIAAGGTLRVTTTDDDAQNDVGAGIVYVLCHRIA